MRSRICAFALAALLSTVPASAAFHFIHVKEVFAGSQAHPNAQYILLQAYDGGQNFVTGHSVQTFDAAGVSTGTFTFPGPQPLPNGADQMTIFVATPDAATIFDITADLAMTAVLDPAGGKVCWDGSTPASCFAWGSYIGSDVGTPYNEPGGLIRGYAARRRLDICGQPATLDACDDTDDSANDWITAVPNPIKNIGTPGDTPPATCGNNTIEGLEGCDDGDTEDGDGCSAVCKLEPIDLAPSDLLVDVTALAPPDSNVNGVFEPGETIRIEPTWSFFGTADAVLTGQLANLTGPTSAAPPFPSYRLIDGAAGYGTLTPPDSADCQTNSDCYRLTVETTGARPVQHWDATVDEILEATGFALSLGGAGYDGVQTWTLHLGNSFPDVTTAHIFYAFIENLFHNGVTGGCAGGNYCPGDPVTRAQMAVFLLKAKFGASHIPPPCTGAVYDDVPCTGGIFDPWIEELADLGITGGCSVTPPLYCPGNTVTRGQMAVFLLKALEGAGYDPPDCAGVFDDVACTPGAGFSDFIEELFARQITGGCSVTPPLYCPGNPNNRGQMAVFLVKTFNLLLYGFPIVVF
jgi:cysteine-rich repeat protein